MLTSKFALLAGRDVEPGELGLEPTTETLDDIIQQIKEMHPDTSRHAQAAGLEVQPTPFSLEQSEAPASVSTESAGSASGLHEAASAQSAQVPPIISQLPRTSTAPSLPAEASVQAKMIRMPELSSVGS